MTVNTDKGLLESRGAKNSAWWRWDTAIQRLILSTHTTYSSSAAPLAFLSVFHRWHHDHAYYSSRFMLQAPHNISTRSKCSQDDESYHNDDGYEYDDNDT